MEAATATTPTTEAPPVNGAAAKSDAPTAFASAAAAPNVQATKKADKDMLKRLKAIEDIGRQIAVKQAKIGEQETSVAEAKAGLDAEREILHKRERELQELQEELNELAIGHFPSKLFPATGAADAKTATAADPKNAKPTPADDNAWRSVSLADLGIKKPKTLELLAGEGVKDFGTLEDWRASGKKIKGLGPAALQEIEDAAVKYWDKNPRQAKAEAAKTAPDELLTCEQLELKPDDVHAAARVHLLVALASDNEPDVPSIAVKGQRYLVTLPSAVVNHRDVYALRPLLPEGTTLPFDSDKPYQGRVVRVDGTRYVIGGDFLLVIAASTEGAAPAVATTPTDEKTGKPKRFKGNRKVNAKSKK